MLKKYHKLATAVNSQKLIETLRHSQSMTGLSNMATLAIPNNSMKMSLGYIFCKCDWKYQIWQPYPNYILLW